MVGTVAYLSPEAIEAGAKGADLDTRADVYTLGVLLYELLAGLRPFGRSSDRDIMNRIVHGDVARPSTALMAMDPEDREKTAAKRHLDVAGLRRALKGDLDAIVLKAMARERSARYVSAAELAADVRRHLAHEPVLAGPSGALYPTVKFIRRHRVSVAAGLLIALALVGGIVARSLEARRANAEARRANQEAERANREAESARQVSQFLAGLFSQANPAKQSRDLTAHELLDRGAERIHRELATQPLVKAHLLQSLGAAYGSLGLYDKGEGLLRESLAIRRAHLGNEHRDVAETLQDLATLLWQQGHYKESISLLEETLRIARRENDPKLLGDTLMTLSTDQRGLGQYAEAERLLLESLALREKSYGRDSEKVSAALNNLGNLYYDMGRYADSEKAQLRAIAIKERVLGPDHFYLAQSYNNLANVYLALHRLPEAEALHRRSLAIKLKTLEPHHPEIGLSYLNLGAIALESGELEKAKAFFQQALDVWGSALNPDHPLRAAAFHGMANVERDLGHVTAAESLYRQVLAIYEKNLPPDHPQVREVLQDYAKLLRDAGRAKEAAALEGRGGGKGEKEEGKAN